MSAGAAWRRPAAASVRGAISRVSAVEFGEEAEIGTN